MNETAGFGGDTPRMVYWWRRFLHLLRHLVPRTHWTVYRIAGWERAVEDAELEELDGRNAGSLRQMGEGREDEQWVCIWRQWLFWEWNVVHFRVAETA